MLAVFATGLKQFFPALGLYPYKLDDVLEKSTMKGQPFKGWVLGLYVNDFIIVENNEIRTTIQVNRIQNFKQYEHLIRRFSDQDFNNLNGKVFTKGYYSTYPIPN